MRSCGGVAASATRVNSLSKGCRCHVNRMSSMVRHSSELCNSFSTLWSIRRSLVPSNNNTRSYLLQKANKGVKNPLLNEIPNELNNKMVDVDFMKCFECLVHFLSANHLIGLSRIEVLQSSISYGFLTSLFSVILECSFSFHRYT